MHVPVKIKGFIYRDTRTEKYEFYTSDSLDGVSSLIVLCPFELNTTAEIPEGEDLKKIQEAKKRKLLDTKKGMELHIERITKQLEEFDHEHK